MLNVLIDLPRHEPSERQLKEISGFSIRWVPEPTEHVRSLPEELVKDVDILCCTFPPENHSQMKRLKLIQITSAGYKQLTRQGFPKRGVKACNALGVFDIPIGEWNIAMMVNLARDLRAMIRNQEQGVWDRSRQFQHEIRGSIVGIWGYGGIGRETARLCKALGMQVHVLTRGGVRPRKDIYVVPGTGDPQGILPDRVFRMEEKEHFLRSLDFLVMAIPHTSETEGIVTERELGMLKQTACLLNPARGPLVKEAALIRALTENRLAGAALDTHYQYPLPSDHPLWGMKNVILTPHISGSSASPHYLERVYDILLNNIKRWEKGAPLLNELSPSELEA